MVSPEVGSLLLLMPVYNDWESAAVVAQEVCRSVRHRVHVVLVDDASSARLGTDARRALREAGAETITIIRLIRNLGHQGAICVGLCWAVQSRPPGPIVIMDSDGEDRASDVPRLLASLAACRGERVVFAARKRRSEGAVFKVGYLFYRILHWCLTGRKIRFGNFSALMLGSARMLITTPSLWIHFAGTVVASRIPHCTVPTARGKRLFGESRMNLVSLTAHGLGAIAIQGSIVGTRVLIASCMAAGLIFIGIGAVVGIRLWTTAAVPGWATYTSGLHALFALQVVVIAMVTALAMIGAAAPAENAPQASFHLLIDEAHELTDEHDS